MPSVDHDEVVESIKDACPKCRRVHRLIASGHAAIPVCTCECGHREKEDGTP